VANQIIIITVAIHRRPPDFMLFNVKESAVNVSFVTSACCCCSCVVSCSTALLSGPRNNVDAAAAAATTTAASCARKWLCRASLAYKPPIISPPTCLNAVQWHIGCIIDVLLLLAFVNGSFWPGLGFYSESVSDRGREAFVQKRANNFFQYHAQAGHCCC